MRRILISALTLPGLVASQAPETPKPQPAPSKAVGNLRVHVETAGGAPLAGARVAIEKLQRSHETGETGHVSMAWIPVGTHEVKISKAGYKAATATATIEDGMVCVLTLRLEAEGK